MTKLAITKKEGLQYEKSGNGLVSFLEKSAAQRVAVLSGHDNLIPLFNDAYKDNKEVATKLLFRLRDPRNGSGEKAAFNKVLYHLYENSPKAVIDNLEGIVKYGSFQNLTKLAKYINMKGDVNEYNALVGFFAEKIKSKDRLANKWAPRLHSDDDSLAKDLRNALGMSNKEYRKWLKENSETIEQQMAQNEWSDILYERVPSSAMKKYYGAFKRNDNSRFEEFKNDKTKKANAGVLYPHDVISMIYNDEALAQKLWENLPDFIAEGKKIFPMIDVSSSMQQPVVGNGKNAVNAMLVAIALGIYLAERNKSVFRNHYLTFDNSPKIMSFGDNWSLRKRYENIMQSPWGGTTNFEAAYRLVLELAIKNKAKQEDLPDIILCLSDMQFDAASYRSAPHIKVFQEMFEKQGYTAPKLVFWNLCEAFTGSPARWNTKDVGLISGFSPSIMKAVLSVKEFNPLEIVYESVEYIDDLILNSLPVSLKTNRSFAVSNDLL